MQFLGFVGWFIIALIVIAFASITFSCLVYKEDDTEGQLIGAWFMSTIIAALFAAFTACS